MSNRLVWITPSAEDVIMYCARVSNPANQDSGNSKLLTYLIKHKHWSPFEMASACVEVETSRIVADQMMRHRSFAFQTFSTRYAEVQSYVPTTPRRQDMKNRQSSHDDLDPDVAAWFTSEQSRLFHDALNTYDRALNLGIAKENARDLLPFSSTCRMYMAGTVRSWVHYLEVRDHEDTQREHRDIARSIKTMLREHLPATWQALGW